MQTLTNKKILVHLHLHYYDQIDYFISKLENIEDCSWDLYVTINEKREEKLKKIKTFKPNVNIIEVENIGFDVYPFLYILSNVELEKYDYIIKLHTKRMFKKNKYVGGIYKTYGYEWRNSLVESLIGSKEQFKDNIKILSDSDYGFICSNNYLYSLNVSTLEDLKNLNKLKLKFSISNSYNFFIAGTMFMVKTDAMYPLKKLNLSEFEFQCVKSGGSNTAAHAFERLFAILAVEQNYKIYTVKTDYHLIKTLWEDIFSIRKVAPHKIITILGIKIKIKSKKLVYRARIKQAIINGQEVEKHIKEV